MTAKRKRAVEVAGRVLKLLAAAESKWGKEAGREVLHETRRGWLVERLCFVRDLKLLAEAVKEKESEWPKWYLGGDGDVYHFDTPIEMGLRWCFVNKSWREKKCWTLADMAAHNCKPITPTEAAAILRK